VIDLESTIITIEKLLEEGSVSSLTYAALECRLAIEVICYEHLRISHNYLPQAEILKWQPGKIVNLLIGEVNPEIGKTLTYAVSADPFPDGILEPTLEDYEAKTWHDLGTQI
jgi:hypothetical protein